MHSKPVCLGLSTCKHHQNEQPCLHLRAQEPPMMNKHSKAVRRPHNKDIPLYLPKYIDCSLRQGGSVRNTSSVAQTFNSLLIRSASDSMSSGNWRATYCPNSTFKKNLFRIHLFYDVYYIFAVIVIIDRLLITSHVLDSQSLSDFSKMELRFDCEFISPVLCLLSRNWADWLVTPGCQFPLHGWQRIFRPPS